MDLKEFGKYIEDLRIVRGFDSQSELARTAGVVPSTVSRIIAGKQRPTRETLRALAPHLGVTYEDLLIRSGYSYDVNSEIAIQAMDRAAELLQKIVNLSPRDQAAVEALILALNKENKND